MKNTTLSLAKRSLSSEESTTRGQHKQRCGRTLKSEKGFCPLVLSKLAYSYSKYFLLTKYFYISNWLFL